MTISPPTHELPLSDLLALAERHAAAFFTEARQLIASGSWSREVPDASAEHDATWTLIDRRDGESQRWPDGNVDTYSEFGVYEGDGVFRGVRLALGRVSTPGKEHEVVGFTLGAQSKRPLTVFFPADDYDSTSELLSLIRGKDGGRGGFGPTDRLPLEYAGFSIDILGRRIQKKFNLKAVVVIDTHDGLNEMLNHTAIQAKTRGLI